MDGWAIGFFVLLGLISLAVLFGFKEKIFELLVGIGFDSTGIRNYLTTWFSLVPYAIFLAGPIVDIVSSQLLYTKASLVGFATVLIVAFFGGEQFAKLSSSLLGFLPSIRDEMGALRWVWIVIYGLFLGLVSVGVALPYVEGKTTIGLGTSAAAFLIVATILAGKDFLGDVDPSTVSRDIVGDTSTSYAGVTISDVCATPGLGCVQTSFAPTGILLNTSILACHFFESLDTGNTKGMTTIGSVAGLTYAIELLTLYSKGCVSAYKYGWASPALISPLLGIGAGAAAYYGMRTVNIEAFTSSDQGGGIFHSPPPPATKTSSEKSSTKIIVGPQPETSEPVDDQDAFVCEAYKDGELVTSTIVD